MRAPAFVRRSLAARLAVFYGLVSVLVVFAMGVGVYLVTERYLARQMEGELEALVEFYAVYTSSVAPDQQALAILAPEIVGFFAPQAGYDVRVFQPQTGALMAASQDLGPLPSVSALSELGYRGSSFFLPASRDLPARLYAARQVEATDGSALAVVELSRDVSQVGSLLGALRLILVAGAGLAVITAWVASLVVARHVTRPLQEMEQVAQAITAGDLERRLNIPREDEIGRLARSVNHMTAELKQLESTRRDFIARISHDLRTPLTAIKGLVINLQDAAPDPMQPALATVDEQTDRLIRLVDDLLTVSRAQRGKLRLDRAEIDLRDVARSCVTLAGGKAGRLGIRLSLDLPESPAPVSGDGDRLQQVALNLIDNALKATAVGGSVKTRVTVDGSSAELVVCDDGHGLGDKEAGLAFEPYYRGRLGGEGLGLTIARDIVEAHGGRIWLRTRPEGGTEAGFALPALPNRDAWGSQV